MPRNPKFKKPVVTVQNSGAFNQMNKSGKYHKPKTLQGKLQEILLPDVPRPTDLRIEIEEVKLPEIENPKVIVVGTDNIGKGGLIFTEDSVRIFNRLLPKESQISVHEIKLEDYEVRKLDELLSVKGLTANDGAIIIAKYLFKHESVANGD